MDINISSGLFSRETLAGYDPERLSSAVVAVVGLGAAGCNVVQTLALADLFALVRDMLATLIDQLPSQQANMLIDALVIIDPFSPEALVPLNVLARDPDNAVAPEVQAYEVASMFERMTHAPTGVVQDQMLFNLILLGVCDGRLSLPDLAPLIMDPIARASVAARSPNAEVRRFFAEGRPLPVSSAAGLQARFSRLLRLPATRLMLGARGCVDFRLLLRDKIVLANLGSPPLGCEDIARWWGGLPLFSAVGLTVLIVVEGDQRFSNIARFAMNLGNGPHFLGCLLSEIVGGSASDVLLRDELGASRRI